MKRINYETYRREKGPDLVRANVAVLNAQTGRTSRQRPRDPEEMAVLGRLIRARFGRLLESGELVRLGPRRWRWTFPEFSTGERPCSTSER